MNTRSGSAPTVIIAFIAFIGLGLTSGLLGLAWPSMQKQFALPLDGVNALYIAQTTAYSIASFYIGRAMTRFGSGRTLLAGMVLMLLSMFGIAVSGSWWLVVFFSLIFGFGSGLIDAGLNLYIAAYHTAQHMNFLHACFGIGITVGPLIMTFVLGQKLGWQAGYTGVGVVLIAVAALFIISLRLWRTEGFVHADSKPVQRAKFAESLRKPAVWFGVITYLAYVGLEIGIGQWAYTILTQSRGVRPGTAGVWVSVYWGAFTGGRILWGFIANRYPIEKVLRYCMLGAFAGTILFWWNPTPILGHVNPIGSIDNFFFWWNPEPLFGLLALIIVGFAQAPIFPMLMAGTAQRVGAEHAENAISLQMTGVGIGTAILPGFIGTVGRLRDLESMPVVFVVMAVVVVAFHELSVQRNNARMNTAAAAK